MRLALDTNILVYAEGVNGDRRQAAALLILASLPKATTFIPVQVLGELFRVLVGKSAFSAKVAQARVADWQASFHSIETSPAILLSATHLAVDHKIGIWDAVIMAAASSAGCRLLLSEDMQDGFTWRGVTVVNPFAAKMHDLLARVLEE